MLRIGSSPNFGTNWFSPFQPFGGGQYTPVDLNAFLQTGDIWQAQMQSQLDPNMLFAAQFLGALMQLDPMALAQLIMMGANRSSGGGRGCGCHLGGMNGGSFARQRGMPGGWGARQPGVSGPQGVGSLPPNASTSERLYDAIIKQESGGNYRAVNPDSGALGIGQVMPFNVGPWSREALGREISPQQFLNSPELQDRIVKFKLDQYYDEARAKGLGENEAVRYVAAKWYSGSGERRNSLKPQGKYPTIRDYTFAVLDRYQRSTATGSAAPNTQNVDVSGIPDFQNLSPRVQEAARIARSMGLRVTSTTGGRHTATSNHYRHNSADGLGHAIDVAGPPHLMARFYDTMRSIDPSPRELFYDPRGGIKRGREIGPIGGHSDHVHYAA